MKYSCKNCIHCDIENKKCYPESKDCRGEYDLTDDDIYGVKDSCTYEGRCDFYKEKQTK